MIVCLASIFKDSPSSSCWWALRKGGVFQECKRSVLRFALRFALNLLHSWFMLPQTHTLPVGSIWSTLSSRGNMPRATQKVKSPGKRKRRGLASSGSSPRPSKKGKTGDHQGQKTTHQDRILTLCQIWWPLRMFWRHTSWMAEHPTQHSRSAHSLILVGPSNPYPAYIPLWLRHEPLFCGRGPPINLSGTK